jgi:hypothetical protein
MFDESKSEHEDEEDEEDEDEEDEDDSMSLFRSWWLSLVRFTGWAV